MLGMPAIRARLAASTRAAIGSFTFPATPQANVLVNASSNQAGVGDADVRVVGDDEIAGSATSGWFCGMPGKYTVYFVLHFDRPFVAHGTWLAKHIMPQTEEAKGAGAGAWVTFDATTNPTIRMKAALSWVGGAGAEVNAHTLGSAWDVDAVRSATARQWSNELSRILVDGGTQVQRRVFYTALYHSFLHPNVYSDADGNYRGFDGQVHRVDAGHVEYATFSGWDIYRTQIPLLAMLEPKRTSDMMRSLVHAAQQSGWLPKWSLVNVESAVMGGDPSDPMLAGAYAFGARDFDARAALRAMLKGATQTTGAPGQGWYFQRPGLDEYLAHGYVVNDHTTNVAPLANGASLTLEYSLDDFAIAQLANALGDRQTYRTMLARSQNWSNLFDRSTGLIAPRDSDGAFVQAPITEWGQSGFQEGTAAQYTWMIPQNLAGLIDGMGGREKAVAQLDAFFTQTDAGQDKPFAWMGNEPSIGSPWAYLAAGAPWKGQRLIRDVMTQLWGDTPDGIPGNDDLGTMSAWYVWCALGLYPQYPAAPVLDVGTPLFPRAAIRVPGGPSIDVNAPLASTDNAYVEAVRINGAPLRKSWIDFSPSRPIRLDVSVGNKPNEHWASSPGDAPPSYGPEALHFPPSTTAAILPPNPAQLTVAPGASVGFEFAVGNAGDTAESISWHVENLDGVTVTPSSGRTDAPPGSSHVIDGKLAVDGRVAEGLYDASIAGASDNGAAVARATVFLRVLRPGDSLRLAYVADPFDNAITPFDVRTHAAGKPIIVGEFPRDVALSPDGKHAYVANNASNDVSVVDTATQTVVATVPVGKGPWGIRVTPDGLHVWVANSSDNTVQEIDTTTLQAQKPVPVGADPEALAITQDERRLYVADVGSNDVTPVDLISSAPLAPIKVGARPRGIAIAPGSAMLYVSNYADNSVTPIEAATGNAGAAIPVGTGPRGLAISPDGRWLFVDNFGTGTVTPISVVTRLPAPSIAVGLNPVAIAVDATGSTAFVVNAGDNDCVPIDLRTLSVGTPIRLGDRPMGISL
jgi:predicted alpha-1,2-mannosidase